MFLFHLFLVAILHKILIIESTSNATKEFNFASQRLLQFESMFENTNSANRLKRKKSSNKQSNKISRTQYLQKVIDDILFEADRYHLWWLGPPPSSDFFQPIKWSASHDPTSNAIFTMAVIQGKEDKVSCSSPNDLILFFGSARKVFQGDIVVALESDMITEEMISILKHYRVIVYILPKDLCSKSSKFIFCGSEDERVPATVFRYFFFEKWATIYQQSSLILISDFRDILFQSNPFEYHVSDWYPDYQMVVYQEFHPNMMIGRCRFNKRIMAECYGDESLNTLGNHIIISSGAILGTRDALIVWSHHMTMQLQEAPGRQVETRCTTGGIDHSFINWLVYGNKLRQTIRIRIMPQGEGGVNTLGGLNPNTVEANLTGSLTHFWKILNPDGYILNWNGDVSPVVHQLDHFLDELEDIFDQSMQHYFQHNSSKPSISKAVVRYINATTITSRKHGMAARDRGWQVLSASQCLWGCVDSINFNQTNLK